MPDAFLKDRALVRVDGPDAETLLQNVVTADLDTLQPSVAMPAALLTPQGKILFDFLISRSAEDGFLLDCRADAAGDLVRRLTLYRLRAKVRIALEDQLHVSVFWQDDSSDPRAFADDPAMVCDARFRPVGAVWRRYGDAIPATGDVAAWHAFRVAGGVAESGADYALGDAFPHDVLLDELGGVGFRKGCYVGQEVVSRMQHRGTARRRVLIVTGNADLPPTGTPVEAGGRPLGALGSVAGRHGLAILRIDRVKDALDRGQPVTAAGATVSAAIPGWANFRFPESSAGTEEA